MLPLTLVLRREARRTEDETQQLAQLRAQQAEVAEAIDLAEDFATLLRQRQQSCMCNVLLIQIGSKRGMISPSIT